MPGDPDRAARALQRRQTIATGTPASAWSTALVNELAELADSITALEAQVTGSPPAMGRAYRAGDSIADSLLQRPDQAYAVAIRILARLNIVPTAEGIAGVRAGLYPATREDAGPTTG